MSQAVAFDDLRDLYRRTVVEHARNPRHGTRLAVFDATGRGDNPRCGDRCAVFVRFGEAAVAEVGFEARGCAISIASADLMADAVAGRTPAEVQALAAMLRRLFHDGHSDDAQAKPFLALSGVAEYRSRIRCATLPWDALLTALEGSPE